MNTTAKYNILDLQKLTLGELYNLALWFKVDTLNKPKQSIIYEILDAQQDKKPEHVTGATVSSGSS
jgi:hypothetical protein